MGSGRKPRRTVFSQRGSYKSGVQGILNYIGSLITVITLNFWTDKSGQTVQTQIRLPLQEQSDQGLRCLLFHLHVFDKIPLGFASV